VERWLSAVICLLALANSSAAGQSPKDTADAIYIGRFVTLDPARPRATALAVKGGRVVFRQ
jgi:hypothetical protein